MRTIVAVMSVALVLASGAGCDQGVPTCQEGVERWWASEREEMDPEVWRQIVNEDIVLCLDLQAQAEEAGCMEAHVAWRECLYHRAGIVDSPECDWSLERLRACLDDTAFETSCDDYQDNDADGLVDCFDPDCAPRCWNDGNYMSVPQSTERAVDILFVIDNSGSMAGENNIMRAHFPALTFALRNMAGGLPDVHVGVTTTDLGTGVFDISYCEEVGGDAGNLVTGSCENPTGGAPYLVDVAPQGCEITREADNTCSAHSCSLADCVGEPTAFFVQDSSTGCPRCRNYADETLEDALSCIASLGTMGCGYEQPLEAMKKALEPANTANTGFLRPDAVLAVLLVTDEDDCSASDPQLYDNTQTDIDSPLGPLTAFRCFEHGVSCDINDRNHQGERQHCVPRQDATALLVPLSSYVEFLQDLRDPQELVVAAIAGPVTASPDGVGHNVDVVLDAMGNPELQYGCTVADGGAVPGIRIHHLIAAFNEGEDLATWAYSSICSADYTPALAGFGNKIKDRLDSQCPPGPFKGCSDVGVEFGSPQALVTCPVNERCLPECVVGEIRYRGTEEQVGVWMPSCLEVCTGGFCQGNTNRSLAYAGGHPPDRDPDLPVEVCWHVVFNPDCPDSNYAELRAARRTDPPPRTFLVYSCEQVERNETLCDDGVDNNENCLVDMNDPCCQNPADCVD